VRDSIAFVLGVGWAFAVNEVHRSSAYETRRRKTGQMNLMDSSRADMAMRCEDVMPLPWNSHAGGRRRGARLKNLMERA